MALELLCFDLRGEMAHFRRPDGTVTHPTYPAPSRTILHGIIGSILGMEKLDGENWVGYSLLKPIKTITQELSMLGKGWMGDGGDSFNRPTSIQLVVKPHYRIYYTGSHFQRLEEMLQKRQSIYHNYLGSAFCLTFPEYVEKISADDYTITSGESIKSVTVVPLEALAEITPQPGYKYIPMRGGRYEADLERNFSGTLNLLIEESGKPVHFIPKPDLSSKCKLVKRNKDEILCLW